MSTDAQRLTNVFRAYLEYGDPDAIVFRDASGKPITFRGALAMLDANDPRIDAFIDDVVRVATQFLRHRARAVGAIGAIPAMR